MVLCQAQFSAKHDFLVPDPQSQSRTWQNFRVLIRTCNKAIAKCDAVEGHDFMMDNVWHSRPFFRIMVSTSAYPLIHKFCHWKTSIPQEHNPFGIVPLYFLTYPTPLWADKIPICPQQKWPSMVISQANLFAKYMDSCPKQYFAIISCLYGKMLNIIIKQKALSGWFKAHGYSYITRYTIKNLFYHMVTIFQD